MLKQQKAIFLLLLQSVLIAFFYPHTSQCTELDSQQSIRAIFLLIESYYGGATETKKADLNLDLGQLKEKYLTLASHAQNLTELHKLIIQLTSEFRDLHFRALRVSNSFHTLGLETALIDDKLIVVGVDRNIVATNITIQVGDEIIAVDSTPIKSLILERMQTIQASTFETRYREAAELTLNIPGRFIPPATDKNNTRTTLTIRRSNRTLTFYLNWINKSEISRQERRLALIDPSSIPTNTSTEPKYHFGDYATNTSYFLNGMLASEYFSGATNPLHTTLNAQIEKNSQSNTSLPPKQLHHIQAYTVATQGTVIGILRIPFFATRNAQDFLWLKEIITRLEKQTQALILDLTGNTGGSNDSAVELLSLLTESKLDTVTMDIRLSSTLLANERLLKPLSSASIGSPISSFLLSEASLAQLRSKHEQGEKWSGPIPFLGNTTDYTAGQPGIILKDSNTTTYSKPLAVLIDDRTASAAELVAGILQANNRAIVVGPNKSMGGVSSVPEHLSKCSPLPGADGIYLQIPMGICTRSDGLPIENVGVLPDLRRPIGMEDFLGRWTTFSEEIIEATRMLAAQSNLNEIQSFLLKNKNTSSSGLKINAIYSTIIAEVASFTKDNNGLLTQPNLNETETQTLITTYTHLFSLLARTELSDEAWKSIRIPIPFALKRHDFILASSETKDALIDRLKTLANLQKIKPYNELQVLIHSLLAGLDQVGPLRFDPKCEDLLEIHAASNTQN